jgi:sporulation protein YlmC with PRC-barrel domain
MLKIPTVVTFAAILGAAAPLASAQTNTNMERPSAVTQTNPNMERHAAVNSTSSITSEAIQPDQIRASKMIGSSVYDEQNRKIGSVKDLVLNKDGTVADVVVDVGATLGMGGKDVALRLSDIKTDNNRLTVDRTKEQLQKMAEYRLENRNTGAGTSTSPVQGGRLGTGSTTYR